MVSISSIAPRLVDLGRPQSRYGIAYVLPSRFVRREAGPDIGSEIGGLAIAGAVGIGRHGHDISRARPTGLCQKRRGIRAMQHGLQYVVGLCGMKPAVEGEQ